MKYYGAPQLFSYCNFSKYNLLFSAEERNSFIFIFGWTITLSLIKKNKSNSLSHFLSSVVYGACLNQ